MNCESSGLILGKTKTSFKFIEHASGRRRFCAGIFNKKPVSGKFIGKCLWQLVSRWNSDETNRCQQNLRQPNLVHRRCESNHFCLPEELPTFFIARRRNENSIKKWFQKLSQKFSIHESPFPKTYILSTPQNQILCQEYKITALDAAVNLPATIVSKNCSKLFGKCHSRNFHATRVCKHECALKTRSKQSGYRLTKLQPHLEWKGDKTARWWSQQQGRRTHHAADFACVLRIFFSRQFVLSCGRFLLFVALSFKTSKYLHSVCRWTWYERYGSVWRGCGWKWVKPLSVKLVDKEKTVRLKVCWPCRGGKCLEVLTQTKEGLEITLNGLKGTKTRCFAALIQSSSFEVWKAKFRSQLQVFSSWNNL